jgi:hypothetical protein
MAEAVRITDLRNPQLTERQQVALAAAEADPVELTSDAVLTAATRETGLSDFGPDDFRSRLDIWLADATADTDLTAFGCAAVYRACVRFAATRLKMVRMMEQHPEIEDEAIVEPIIVIGLPRSGTTHLVNLLAADPRRRSLPYWEACDPVPGPDSAHPDPAQDPRRERSEKGWQLTRELLPLMELMHPFEPDHIHEELELQGPDFSSYYPEWLFRAARWREHYSTHDQTPHYEYLRSMLKLLQWVRGPRQWVLKSPQHLEQIPVLLKVFPDARIVMTQRDPVATLQSAITMSAYTGRLRYAHGDIDALCEFWSARVEDLLRAAVRDAEQIPMGQRFDVNFHDLNGDDMAVMTQLYAAFGIEFPDDVRERLRAYSEGHRRGHAGRITYDLKSDFGVDPDKLHQRYSFYFDAFPTVRREVQ